MKNERLLAILDCLLLEGKKTAEELAGRFHVSVRTVYRDIDSLCVSGVPIVADAGAGGGYSIEEGYRVDRSFFSPDEVEDLTSLLKAFAARDRNLERSLGKISALGPRGSKRARERSRDHLPGTPLLSRSRAALESELPPPLIAELSPWGAPTCDPATVWALRRAIAERRLVTFRYVDGRGGETVRNTEPFSVVIGGATWYLHAWCRLRASFRLFKIARMNETAEQH